MAETELSVAEVKEMDVEAVLAFAVHVLSNAASLLKHANADQQQAFQAALSPKVSPYGREFETAVTCSVFAQLPRPRPQPEQEGD